MLLLAINVILLFVGSVLEPPAAILLLTPLLTPLAYAAGVHPIHFGIIVTVNLAIGLFMALMFVFVRLLPALAMFEMKGLTPAAKVKGGAH